MAKAAAEKMIRLEALTRFCDGNAYPKGLIEKGDEVIVTARRAKMMKRSDPTAFKVVGIIVPKSTAAPVEKGKGDDKKT